MEKTGDRLRDAQNVEGTLVTVSPDGVTGEATVRLPPGEIVSVPCNLISPEEDGTYRLRGTFTDWARPHRREAHPAESEEATVVPVSEESVRIERRARETGRVRVSKHITERTEHIDEPILHDEVEVKRIPVGRILERPVGTRHTGDTTIIPVLEERLVIQKQLILKEEIHVTRRTTTARKVQDVPLRTEEVDVARIPPSNQPLSSSS
ncbi:MAG TPA: YsnF/AvaK domain-containing protein [Rhodothermales bacterium]|nr:YsnF/AvaK domain-containing protein [Rhodothermales bacterium]